MKKFLNEIASQGFLVIASGYIPMEEKPYRGPQSTSAQQIESIDWAIAWLKWQLKGDQEAARMFQGDPCGLSQREGWTVEKNALID